MAKGWVPELAPPLQLAREKACDVVPCSKGDRARVGLERLDEHVPRRVPPAPSGQLGDQLKCLLFCPEIGDAETRVGVDHGGELDTCEVMSLRDHLRAEQHG